MIYRNLSIGRGNNMIIKRDYDEPIYKLGDIVLYKGYSYVVIGHEMNFDYHDYQYELSPYEEKRLKFARKEELEATD